MSKIDCVVGYHVNPLTCGVAKFNAILAERLGVPHLHIFDPQLAYYHAPLLSIKCSEFNEQDLGRLHIIANHLTRHAQIHLFLHDFSDTMVEYELIRHARGVYCGNSEICERLRQVAPAAVEMWSPATISRGSDFKPGEVTLFSFGMAHKLRATLYRKLALMLERTGRSYTIYISTALHEGTSFDGSFTTAIDQMTEFFGNRVRFLGFLSDEMVCEYLRHSRFFVAFFERGARANNSSLHAAMEAGAVVLTNLDGHSPDHLRHEVNILNIEQLDDLPLDPAYLDRIVANARQSVEEFGWDRFVDALNRAGAAAG